MHNNYKIIQKLLFKMVLDKAFYTTQHFINFLNDNNISYYKFEEIWSLMLKLLVDVLTDFKILSIIFT